MFVSDFRAVEIISRREGIFFTFEITHDPEKSLGMIWVVTFFSKFSRLEQLVMPLTYVLLFQN